MSHQPRREIPPGLLKGRHLPNLGRARRIKLSLPKRRKVLSREKFSTRAFQSPRLLRRRCLTRTRIGGHHHPHIRRSTNRHRVIGIPAIPPCGSIQIKGTPIRCIPAPALSITPSHITHLEHTSHQCPVTGHRCTGIICR